MDKGPQARGCGQILEAGKDKGTDSFLELPEEMQHCQTS